MKFLDFICFEAIVPQLESTDRDLAITEMVNSLEKHGKLGKLKASELISLIIKRENEASTGMGKGVAIPHVKCPDVTDVIGVIGRSPVGIDFSSLDKQPVYSAILLISPANDPDKHLQAMENVFKWLQQEKFRKFLQQSETVEQITDLLREVDENPDF